MQVMDVSFRLMLYLGVWIRVYIFFTDLLSQFMNPEVCPSPSLGAVYPSLVSTAATGRREILDVVTTTSDIVSRQTSVLTNTPLKKMD